MLVSGCQWMLPGSLVLCSLHYIPSVSENSFLDTVTFRTRNQTTRNGCMHDTHCRTSSCTGVDMMQKQTLFRVGSNHRTIMLFIAKISRMEVGGGGEGVVRAFEELLLRKTTDQSHWMTGIHANKKSQFALRCSLEFGWNHVKLSTLQPLFNKKFVHEAPSLSSLSYFSMQRCLQTVAPSMRHIFHRHQKLEHLKCD